MTLKPGYVECPTCEAAPSKPCTGFGIPLTYFHTARRYAVKHPLPIEPGSTPEIKRRR